MLHSRVRTCLSKAKCTYLCDACLSVVDIFGLSFCAESESKPVNTLIWL
jgi:hypothetical protein